MTFKFPTFFFFSLCVLFSQGAFASWGDSHQAYDECFDEEESRQTQAAWDEWAKQEKEEQEKIDAQRAADEEENSQKSGKK
jgi:hypothetical protein